MANMAPREKISDNFPTIFFLSPSAVDPKPPADQTQPRAAAWPPLDCTGESLPNTVSRDNCRHFRRTPQGPEVAENSRVAADWVQSVRDCCGSRERYFSIDWVPFWSFFLRPSGCDLVQRTAYISSSQTKYKCHSTSRLSTCSTFCL